MADTDSTRPTVRLDCVATVAADMERTLGFYRRLGCAAPAGAEQEGHVDVDLGGGVRLMVDAFSMLLELGLVEGEQPPSPDRPRTGVSLAARCGSPAELDALYAELAADGHGVTEPWDAPWGQRYAVLRDPDGRPSAGRCPRCSRRRRSAPTPSACAARGRWPRSGAARPAGAGA